jgi:hypothetical protein
MSRPQGTSRWSKVESLVRLMVSARPETGVHRSAGAPLRDLW